MKVLTRREFLKGSLTGAGLVIGASWLDAGARLWAASDESTEGLAPNVWLRIARDESVTIAVSKSEMGQGVYTSLPMIVADELEADWKRVRIESAPADPKYIDPRFGMQATGGSTSIRNLYETMRLAGAAAREMLVEAAARQWGVAARECEAAEGAVKHPASGRRLTYGGLCRKAAALPVPQKPVLKEPGRWRYIDKPWPRLDAADKVNGKANFGIDSFIKGMLYGAVARPPAYGAKPASYDEKAARAVPGVRHVAVLDSGIGVCADTLEAAWEGRKALAVSWGTGAAPEWSNAALDKIHAGALRRDGIAARNDGDAKKAFEGAVQKLSAEYRLPYLCHSTMEPMNCTADVRPDGCDVWAATQNQTGVQSLAASISGLPPGKIRVHTTYLGGGFGRRFELDVVGEALALSKSSGRPVKLIWTREEDMQNGFYRPGSRQRVEAGLDRKGSLVAWSHKTVVPSIFARVFPSMIRDGIDHSAVEGISDSRYGIPNFRVEWVRLDEAPVPVGFWRSVGHSSNAFVVESFIDELAHAAGKDPLKFRLELLDKHPRPRRLLEFVAEKADWGGPMPAGRGRGIAQHFSFGTFVAMAAEVSVDKKEGTIKVHRIVTAADCGRLVNRDIAKAQLEGAALMGLSAALKEQMSFAEGGVESRNFDGYELLRLSEAPEVEAHLLPSGEALGGLGEPGLPPVAPAVANAVFAASGIRVRRLPMIAEAVLEAAGG